MKKLLKAIKKLDDLIYRIGERILWEIIQIGAKDEHTRFRNRY